VIQRNVVRKTDGSADLSKTLADKNTVIVVAVSLCLVPGSLVSPESPVHIVPGHVYLALRRVIGRFFRWSRH